MHEASELHASAGLARRSIEPGLQADAEGMPVSAGACLHASMVLRVRGIIVCRTISEDLRLACSSIPDVELCKYQLSVSVSKVPALARRHVLAQS